MVNRRPSRTKQSSFKRSTGSSYDSDRSMGDKFVVTATGKDEKGNYVVRKETINTRTNSLFFGKKTNEAVKKKYEQFWLGKVRVLEVKRKS